MRHASILSGGGKAALIACAIFGAAGPSAAAGVQYTCANGDVVRAVEIQEPGSSGLACEVIYRKPTEGEPERSIWRASQDTGFCRDKAVELIALLTASGWNCAEAPTGPAPDDPAAAVPENAPVSEAQPDAGPDAEDS
ncbi:MAG: hypothetical protein AAF869_03295 [Pseudomonadota bacterium]